MPTANQILYARSCAEFASRLGQDIAVNITRSRDDMTTASLTELREQADALEALAQAIRQYLKGDSQPPTA